MSTLVALFLRLIVLAVLTFAFVVLFEHGVDGFKEGIGTEALALKTFVQTDVLSRDAAPASTPVPAPVSTPEPTATPETVATPTPTPVPTPEPGASISGWNHLQSAPIGRAGQLPIGGGSQVGN